MDLDQLKQMFGSESFQNFFEEILRDYKEVVINNYYDYDQEFPDSHAGFGQDLDMLKCFDSMEKIYYERFIEGLEEFFTDMERVEESE